MQKKLLAVAVAGALAAPVTAMAQVTVSGAINIWYEQAGATGASNNTTTGATVSSYDVKSRDRVRDSTGSNIRFTAVEDISSGMQAFAQVESAVIANADTNADGLNAGGAGGAWATRNSGVGLRGSAWGEFLIGIWDVHYNESYAVDNQLLKGASNTSSLGLLGTFGTVGVYGGTAATAQAGTLGGARIGARYSNVLRYQSPSWGGFNFKVAYARPSDGLVNTTTGSVSEGTKNKAISFAPAWSNGPIYVGYSYLKDADITGATGAAMYSGATVSLVPGTVAALPGFATTIQATLWTVTSSRLQGAYTFPFGLKLGLIVDASKIEGKATTVAPAVASNTELKRTVWSIPVSWNTGAHTIFATYARAAKLKGTINNQDIGTIQVLPAGSPAGTTQGTIGENSSAKFYSLGYQFDLSKRTNVHVSFTQIKNDSLVGYDFFSNTSGMAGQNFGADPRIILLGLRHAF